MRYLAFLFYGFIAVVSVWWVGTPLITDVHVILSGAVPAEGWRIDKAGCETDWLIVSRCTVTASKSPSDSYSTSKTGSAPVDSPRRFHATYVMLGAHQPPARIDIVRSAADGAETSDVSTSFGQQTLIVRAVTFIVYAALLVGVVYVNTGPRSPAQLGVQLGAWLRQPRRPTDSKGANSSRQRPESSRVSNHRSTSSGYRLVQAPKPAIASRVKSKRPPGWFT